MSYEKQTWQTGDVVTSAKLNHMEDGIAGGGALVLHYDSDVNGVDKTWQEIYDAAAAGQVVLYQTILSETKAAAFFLGNVELFNGTYSVKFYQGEQSETLYADSANGKPYYVDG